MNKKRIGIFIALLAMVCMGLRAQSATSLRINEVLVVNDQNYQDDYGLHNAWIEIFNTSFASVNLEGCFLTNDKNNPTKYPIPKGDVLTLIKPRQHALFWADGMPNRGTFHVNFTLDPNKENYIALYDSNGIGMAIIAMSVVFIGLVLLYLSFKAVGNVAVRLGKKNAMKATGITDKTEAKEKNLGSHTGEETAAIAMALHEYLNDAHDVEDMILTINKVKRTYSPWSSKIYTLRQTPKR